MAKSKRMRKKLAKQKGLDRYQNSYNNDMYIASAYGSNPEAVRLANQQLNRFSRYISFRNRVALENLTPDEVLWIARGGLQEDFDNLIYPYIDEGVNNMKKLVQRVMGDIIKHPKSLRSLRGAMQQLSRILKAHAKDRHNGSNKRVKSAFQIVYYEALV